MGEAAASETAKLVAAFDDFFTVTAEQKERIDRAAAVTGCYIRSLMYHKFTGMPKRGLMRQLLPPCDMHTLDYWAKLGVGPELLREPWTDPELGVPLYSFVFDGPVFYEVAERRLDREDYERRLAARTVQRWEWYSREKSRRGILRAHRRSPGPTGEQQEAFAYNLMGGLVAGIVAHARRTETDGRQRTEEAGG